MSVQYSIIYGITKYEGPIRFFFPEPFIARNKKGVPQYMEKQALPNVIESYNLEVKDTFHEQLLSLCDQLNPQSIENKYQPKSKRKKSLDDLLEIKEVATAAKLYVDAKLNLVFQTLYNNNLPIYLQIERKAFLDDIKYVIQPTPLAPSLRFHKKDTGTDYQLKLMEGQHEIDIRSTQTELVTNRHPWLLTNNKAYQLADINGNKIIPFLKKNTIFIPERLTKTYFQKFITSMIGLVDVEVEGFEVIEHNAPANPKIKIAKDFISGKYILDVIFKYGESSFSYGDAIQQRVNLKFDEKENIEVVLNKRNPSSESTYIQEIEKANLSKTASNRFECAYTDDPFAIFSWLSIHKSALEKKGWHIDTPLLDDKKICIDQQSLKFSHFVEGDWFDLQAVIWVGQQQISFTQLLQNIKEGDRIFRLKDDLFFIIPEEWMARFAKISKHAELSEDGVKLSKANFTLLEEDNEDKGMAVVGIRKEHDVDFEVPTELQATLRPYQLEGVKWLATHRVNKLGACLADDMGLGKTLQAITILLYAKMLTKSTTPPVGVQISLFDPIIVPDYGLLKALVIVPASLSYNWEEEIKKFAPILTTYRHIGPKRSKSIAALSRHDIIISTYQTVLKDIELIKLMHFEYIIIDECQYIKNRGSKIFQNLRLIHTNHKISLSGTPIENSLADLWSQMEFINPAILGSFSFFKKHFLIPIEKEKDEDAIKELKLLLEPFILRRTKAEVLDDLPELLEQVVYCPLEKGQHKLIEKEKSKIRNFLLGVDYQDPKIKFHVFSGLLRLRQLANHPALMEEHQNVESGKFEVVCNTIVSLVKSGNKLLLFSSFKKHLKLYQSFLAKKQIEHVSLTGDHSAEKRALAINEFSQNKQCKVFLISIKAGGVGLNLTAANYILILDPWWNPFIEKQAIARAHRIGQTQKVNVLRFISKDSIEEKIQRLQLKKLELADQFVDVGGIPDLEKDVVLDLIH